MSERARRPGATANKDARSSALKELRKRREQGLSALADDESDSDSEAIFDNVTAQEFDALARRRIQEDDFVVDDDGSGYVDNGEDEWGKKHAYGSSDEEESGDERGKRKKSKKDKSSKKPKPEHQIGAMLAQQAKKAPPAAPKRVNTTKADENLMNDIFADLDSAPVESLASDRPAAAKQSYSYASRPKPMLSSTAPSSLHKKEMDTSKLLEAAMFGKAADARKAAGDVAEQVVKEEMERMRGEGSGNGSGMEVDAAGPAFFGGDNGQNDDDYGLQIDTTNDEGVVVETTEASTAGTGIGTAEVQTRTVSTAKAGTTKKASAFLPQFAPAPAPAVASVVQASLKTDAANWHSIRDQMTNNEATVEPTNNAIPATAENVLEADGSLRIFFLDAYEAREKGEVYLFGKVLDRGTNRHVSICVQVNGIQRRLFVLPRPRLMSEDGKETDIETDMKMVYEEFDALRRKKGVKTFKSKSSNKKYAFEIADVPAESDYLEVLYPFTEPELPSDATGRTFSRIFGTRTSALELFLLDRDIRGPAWLTIKNPQFTNRPLSWCKIEVAVNKPSDIAPAEDASEKQSPTPPLTVMCLSMKTFMNHQKHANEVVVASAVVYPNLNIDDPHADARTEHARFTVVRKLDAMPYPTGFQELATQQGAGQKVEVAMNERMLLSFLIVQLQRFDPDVIVGHNFIGFDLDVLLHRMKHHKIDGWSRIGRLRRTVWPKLQAGAGGGTESTYAEKQIASGRLICDTWLTAKEHIRAKSYSLSNLSLTLLKTAREEVDFDSIPQYFHRATDLMTLVKHTETDAYLAAMIMFKIQVLPLSKQITNLAGNLWSRTLIGGRAERNEMLLLHEFHKLGYIVPDKAQAFGGPKKGNAGTAQAKGENDDDDDEAQNEADARRPGTTGRRKPAYAGGLVLEPKKGLYDKYVLLLDFNSLYPSIIQEYNVDFTTVTRPEADAEDQLPEVPDQSLAQGVLPKLLKTLVERRRQVKALMKGNVSVIEMGQYDIRQKALKLTANSMYGCLGFSHSRFYCKPLAMLITSKGREILQSTVDLAETTKLEVIYGDTDSIMIYTNTDDLNEVKRMGNEFKKLVNQRYKLLEIEVDGFYRRMLLLKKKKYAALTVTETAQGIETTVESKGLDMVRRDWCGLSQDVSAYVLDQILSGDETAGREEIVERIHTYLRKVGEETRAGLIPIEKLVINKSLTKNVKDYNDAKVQPHVQVALRMEARGQVARVGDTIPYVICVNKDGSKDNSIATRAYHPDEVMKEDSGLVIDYEWYLQNQIVGPVQRLCDPIEGTDSGRIADCLGLDSTRYRQAQAYQEFDQEEVKTLDSQISDEERFKDVERWTPKCRHCQQHSEFELLRTIPGEDLPVCGVFCPNTDCRQLMPVPSLLAQLSTSCRSHVEKYQQSWLVCDDLSCGNRTRQVSVYGKRCLVRGCKGVMKLEYSDTKLFTQLSYYESLVDVERLSAKLEDKDYRDTHLAVVSRFRESLSELKRAVNAYLSKNARNFVDLEGLFTTLSLVNFKVKLERAAVTA